MSEDRAFENWLADDCLLPRSDKLAHMFGSFICCYLIHIKLGFPFITAAMATWALGFLLEYAQWIGYQLFEKLSKESDLESVVVVKGFKQTHYFDKARPPKWWHTLYAWTIGVDKFSLYDIIYNTTGITLYILLKP